MQPKFIILLLSGGLDSTVLLYWLLNKGFRVHCVLFDYGQRHQTELNYAKAHCRKTESLFTILSIPTLNGSKLTDGSDSWVVPNRNAVMLSMAVNLAVVAKADSVAYACNADDQADFPDCRPKFLEAFNTASILATGIEVTAPFMDITKRQIVEIGRGLGVDMSETWSCYAGGNEPCGKCPACLKREAALCS